jgi:GLPGLI family protein
MIINYKKFQQMITTYKNHFRGFALGFLFVFVGFVLPQHAQAQFAYFPQEGVITYEKTVHVKNILRRHINNLGKENAFQARFYEELLSKAPETTVFNKKMSFRGKEVFIESEKQTFDPVVTNLIMSGLLDHQGTVYQNFDKNISKSLFEMGGSQIYVEDKLLDVKWKLTNEYRNIAGYDCRRANGVTLDSVYVVAFFTDQIPTTAGPGTVHGLPGMIMGLAVPEQHYSIYATKVEYTSPTIKSDIAGRRTTPLTREGLIKQLNATIGSFMSIEQRNLIFASMLL